MSKPLDSFAYSNGTMSADGVSLEQIAAQVGTPAYVYSASAFLKPIEELQKGLAGLDHLVCFAVKSNSNLAILKLLHQAGAGMDLVSGGELFRAKAAGVASSKIVFSGVGKTEAEMESALLSEGGGIFSFNVESVPELEQLDAVARRLGKQAPVALRFNPDVDAKTHPYISTGLKKNKFGMDRKEILKVVKRLAQLSGISLRGISIHIGSQLLSLSPLNDAFGRAALLAAEIEKSTGKPLTFLDLGGGIGITYRNEKSPEISKYCAMIQKHFGKKSKLKARYKILIEPGRTVAGNSGVLLTEVLFRKERAQKDFIIVDAAMNDLLRPSLYGSYHEIVPVEKAATRGKKKKADIVGPVCETGDCLAHDRQMPTGVGKGDLLAILSAGAYGFSMSGNYNSRPRPAEVLVENGVIRVIRRRETLEDLIRGESP